MLLNSDKGQHDLQKQNQIILFTSKEIFVLYIQGVHKVLHTFQNVIAK